MQSLRDLLVEILNAPQFAATGCLTQKLVYPVPDKTTHSFLKHSPLGAVSFEVIASGKSSKKVSVDPALYPGQPVGTVLVQAKELVLETGDVLLLNAYSRIRYANSSLGDGEDQNLSGYSPVFCGDAHRQKT